MDPGGFRIGDQTERGRPPRGHCGAGVPPSRGGQCVRHPADRWVAGSDGRIAVIDHDQYRVRIRSPAGVWRSGAPIPYAREPLSDSVKRDWLAQHGSASGIVVSHGTANSGTHSRAQVARGNGWTSCRGFSTRA